MLENKMDEWLSEVWNNNCVCVCVCVCFTNKNVCGYREYLVDHTIQDGRLSAENHHLLTFHLYIGYVDFLSYRNVC